jgi:hypothetical protein
VARVKRMASLSSFFGISTVVFMASRLASNGIPAQPFWHPLGRGDPRAERHTPTDIPPSTKITCPVMKPASSDARKA